MGSNDETLMNGPESIEGQKPKRRKTPGQRSLTGNGGNQTNATNGANVTQVEVNVYPPTPAGPIPTPQTNTSSEFTPREEVKPTQGKAEAKTRKWTCSIEIAAAVITAVGLIIVAIINNYSQLFPPSATRTPTLTIALIPTVTFTPTATVTNTPAPTHTPTITHTFTPPPLTACSFRIGSDDDTIRNLIKAEATASVNKDMEIIRAIFAPDAKFYDYAVSSPTKPKIWDNPEDRYAWDLFKNASLRGVEHFDIQQVGPKDELDTTYYVSGSRGEYLSGQEWKSFRNGGTTIQPTTTYGSDHWVLKKNNAACWVIVRMEFNAGHIPFPSNN